MKIAKVDTEERGGGGDGLAKEIHHKGGSGGNKCWIFLQPDPPLPPPTPPRVPLEQLPRRLGGKKMACLALKLGHEDIVVLGHFCAEVIT